MDWKSLPDNARVWIYQSDKKLTDEEVTDIKKDADEFIGSWSSHGTPLRAAIEVFYNLFLVVFVDEEHAKATGCSIDKSMGFVKRQEDKLGLSFTDRMQIAYQENGVIKTTRLPHLSSLAKNGVTSGAIKFFDNLVNTKKSFAESWLVDAEGSWIGKFL